MINSIADTYDSIERMIAEIDEKHVEYTNASIDKIRYMMNSDRSAKGKLIGLLKHMDSHNIYEEMNQAVEAYHHTFADMQSLYDRVKRTVKNEGKPLPIKEKEDNTELVQSFLEDVRKQYSNKKIDDYMEGCFGERTEINTEDFTISSSEDFILFLLGTIRGREKSAGYKVEFGPGNVDCQGFSLPKARFTKKREG